MTASFVVQSVVDLIICIAIVVGLMFEDKLAAWEVKTWHTITDRVKSAKRHGE